MLLIGHKDFYSSFRCVSQSLFFFSPFSLNLESLTMWMIFLWSSGQSRKIFLTSLCLPELSLAWSSQRALRLNVRGRVELLPTRVLQERETVYARVFPPYLFICMKKVGQLAQCHLPAAVFA